MMEVANAIDFRGRLTAEAISRGSRTQIRDRWLYIVVNNANLRKMKWEKEAGEVETHGNGSYRRAGP
jgi:hypothetical protein